MKKKQTSSPLDRNGFIKADYLINLLASNSDMLDIAINFSERLFKSNPIRQSYSRPLEHRRLDALARLLEGDEICTALAFDNGKIFIGTNRNEHVEDSISIKIELKCVFASSNKNLVIFQPVIEFSYNANPPKIIITKDNITYKLDRNKRKLILDENNTLQTISITPLQHGIPFLPAIPINLRMSFSREMDLNDIDSKFLSQFLDNLADQKIPTPFNFTTKFDPLSRRLDMILRHLVQFYLLKDNPVDKSAQDRLVDSRLQLLHQSLAWAAAKLFMQNSRSHDMMSDAMRGFKPKAGQFKNSVDQLIDAICNDFNQYMTHIPFDINGVKNWLKNIVGRIKTQQLKLPNLDNVSHNDGIVMRIIKMTKRYLLDIEKIEKYVNSHTSENSELLLLLARLTKDNDFMIKKSAPAEYYAILDDLAHNVHAEMRVIFDFEKKGRGKPKYVAISKLCCAFCKYMMDQKGIEAIPGGHAVAYPWKLMEHSKESLKEFLGEVIFQQLEKLSSKSFVLGGKQYSGDELATLVIQSLPNLNFYNNQVSSLPKDLLALMKDLKLHFSQTSSFSRNKDLLSTESDDESDEEKFFNPNLIGELNGDQFKFTEAFVSPNNDCGFISLGITRQQFYDRIFPLLGDVQYRMRLRDEIASALRLDDFELPEDLQDEYWSLLIDDNAQEILNFCLRQDVVELYITAYKDTNLWLGHDSALLYAALENFNLYIWRRVEGNKKLAIQNCVTHQHPKQTIHMLHTWGNTHYNLLFTEPVPLGMKSKLQGNKNISSSCNPQAFSFGDQDNDEEDNDNNKAKIQPAHSGSTDIKII